MCSAMYLADAGLGITTCLGQGVKTSEGESHIIIPRLMAEICLHCQFRIKPAVLAMAEALLALSASHGTCVSYEIYNIVL